ncbi:hypothetical protein WJX72_011804 [[Myrmecia] bisecta]|uniref:S-acyltransferase n=1 Tax=[Myrmecia] bisecta TaxID=41462 RepID=A0AAW1Q7B1_9CHLO
MSFRCRPAWILKLKLRGFLVLGTAIEWWSTWTDHAMRKGGPMYVAVATVLILFVAFVFFSSVLPEVSSGHNIGHRLAHGCLGAVLLANILFNYYQCVRTPPGTTQDCLEATEMDEEAGLDAGSPRRFCHRCQRAKPPLTHHCHICDKCVLRMDHHCPWMHNCIGFYNYRFFFLFVFYLWAGSMYAAFMTWLRLNAITDLAASQGVVPQHPRRLVFTFVVATAVAVALTILLACHLYFVLTAQGTIDVVGNLSDWWEARQRGERWANLYDLGPKRNFQETFDARGRWWWVTWLLPSVARKQGSGATPLTSRSAALQAMPGSHLEHVGLATHVAGSM